MAKFFKADESIVKIVDEIANELGLAQYGIDFETLDVVNLKQAVKVVRANEYAEYLSSRENLILILVNGEMFDLVPEGTDENGLNARYMWLRLAMDEIAYDSEKDKIIIGVPTLNIPVGCYEKYGKASIDAALLAHYTLALEKCILKTDEAQRVYKRLNRKPRREQKKPHKRKREKRSIST